MTSRADFMRQMGISDADLRTPPDVAPTSKSSRQQQAPKPFRDDDDDVPRARQPPAAPTNTNASARSREEFLRSLGIDNATAHEAENNAPLRGGGARAAAGGNDSAKFSSPLHKSSSWDQSRGEPAAAPPANSGAASRSREEFLRSLGIDNASSQPPAPAPREAAAARGATMNATGSQELSRSEAPRVPSASDLRRRMRGAEEDEEVVRPANISAPPPDVIVGHKPHAQKAPATPHLDAELRTLQDSASAEETKALGNKFFQAGDFRKAVRLYTKAIELDPSNSALYSNRSAAYLLGGKQMGIDTRSMALRDADKTIKLKPAWFKGYSRRGDALFKLERYADAAEAYEAALERDPGNASIVNSLNEVRPFVTGKKDPSMWVAGRNPDLHSSVASLSSTKNTSKSAYELLDEFQAERDRVAPHLGRGGNDYKSAELERFRMRRSDTEESGDFPAASPLDKSASRAGASEPSARPAGSTSSGTYGSPSAAVPAQFSSDAARDYQEALLESYRKKKAMQMHRK